MKIKNFLQNKKLRVIIVVISALAGTMIFQAQDSHRFGNDNDPYIDQPTREAYSHFHGGNQMPAIITDALGFDNFDIGVNFYENMTVQNPNNPLWLFFGVNAGSPPQNAWNSTNAGLNWTLNNPQYPSGTCCDPWAAYDGDGHLVYGSGVSGQYVYISTNNGATWTAPVLSVSGFDRNTLAAENTNLGPYANYMYAAITPGNFARSTNHGTSWTTTYSSSNSIPGTMIAVGPDGATEGGCIMYVTNTGSSSNVTYTFHRSLDGGATFTVMSSLTVAGIVGTFNAAGRNTVNNMRTRPYPMIAIDNRVSGPTRGRWYLVYASNEPPGNGNRPDIKLQYSTDQGATWSSWVRVNDNSNPELSDQWYPQVFFERNSGRLYISWYDDRSNPATFQNDVYGTYTTNGGVTFATNQRLTNATWTIPCPACSPNTNCYRGDYNGISANVLTSFTVFDDHRNCSALSMGVYFPDFAMKVNPAALGVTNINDSAFSFVSVPSVKLWTWGTRFSATVTPPPASGTLTFTFLNKTSNALQDSLTSYPDSLRLRVRATGGVTPGAYTITVKGNGYNGTPVHIRTISLSVNPLGLVNNNNEIPNEYYLYQNFPNPFNPATNIRFDLPKAGLVKITVYDITGKSVGTVVNGNLSAGKYTADFNAENISSGVYFYKIETPYFSSIRKMIVLK
ncbi:MAG: T9SS type A sorting domain-containing protein [Ignavibacteria bacterium]